MATLAQIRERVRNRADIVSETARYPDSELTGYINVSFKELWGLLVRSSLVRDEASQIITADGSPTYDLAPSHYSTIGVFRMHGTSVVQLSRNDQRQRPHGAATAYAGTGNEYRIAKIDGTKTIEFTPRPASGEYIVSYIPEPADLALETDVVDLGLDWEEYIVIDAAIKCLRREGSSTKALKEDKAEIFVRIRTEAEDQEEGKLGSIQDTDSTVDAMGGYNW